MKAKSLFTKAIIAAVIVLLAGAAFVQPAAAQSTCGSKYTVQPGDWMAKIARQCGVTYSALLAANPQITTPWLIYPGQVLNIPGGIPDTGSPALGISPTSGTPGTTVNVTGSGFPAGSVVRVGPAPSGGDIVSEKQVTASSSGGFTTTITIPNNATIGSKWVIRAFIPGSGTEATSPNFTVTDFGSVDEDLTISPTSGPAHTQITVRGAGWTPGATVRLVLMRKNGAEISEAQAVASSSGSFSQWMTIPDDAANGQQYFVRGAIPGAGFTEDSNFFTVGTSTTGNYTVQRGDTMYKIATRFGVSLSALLAANPQVGNGWLIYPGQVLTIPGGTGGQPDPGPQPGYYTVKRGDTLREIAAMYNTTWQSLWSLNPQIWNPNIIYPGQVIRVA